MKNRTYNILFHTHTVSGIVISVVLYIIFFAGSFSFFRDEIVNWERNETVAVTNDIDVDFNAVLDTLNNQHILYGRDIELRKNYVEQRIGVSLSASKDTILNKDGSLAASYFYLDTKNTKQHSYLESYSLGEFLYRLHFLAQIPYPVGYYLSGFIALFFLFAIVTGVIIHWKKIVSNFFVFRPLQKLKTVWTDAHTALGMIGLPFQFVYAVTGAFFMIKLLLVAPNVMVLFNGNQAKFYETLEYSHPQYEFHKNALDEDFNVNTFINKTKKLWKNFNVNEVHIFNYGNQNMHVLVSGHLDYNQKFNGIGEAIYNVKNNQLVHKKTPHTTSYLDGVKNTLFRLHFADYGGYTLKIISFVLGLITCFVIISGVLIWLVARQKKDVPETKKRFNQKVVSIYLAICLSMYPVTALAFSIVKIVTPISQGFLYKFYFISWLLASAYFMYKRDIKFINKYTLLAGSILGYLVPITNGIVTGNWFFIALKNNYFQVFLIDVFWIVLSTITLFAFFKLKNKP